MTNTLFTATQAVARAKSYTTYQVGRCLNFVWHCLDYPRSAGLADADEAWQKATLKRYTKDPPAGAVVYWATGDHGHVAISLGNGNVRSTDWPDKGHVGNVSIDHLTSWWSATYRGWSADYAGHPITGVAPGVTYPAAMVVDLTAPIYASNLRPGKTNNDVSRFERALWNYLGGPYRQTILADKAKIGDGYYGTLTNKMCLDAYAKAKITPAGEYPGGVKLLQALGFTNAKV